MLQHDRAATVKSINRLVQWFPNGSLHGPPSVETFFRALLSLFITRRCTGDGVGKLYLILFSRLWFWLLSFMLHHLLYIDLGVLTPTCTCFSNGPVDSLINRKGVANCFRDLLFQGFEAKMRNILYFSFSKQGFNAFSCSM